MADNDKNQAQGNISGIVDSQVLNLGVSEWQTSLANAVNETYSYANSSLFCAVVSGYYRDYAYRYIRPACQWLDGYVPSLHWSGSGMVSTRIASALINGLARTITGEKLIYKIIGDSNDPKAMETLKFISKWGEKLEIKRAIKNAIGFALGVGTSLLKANRRDNGDIWWEGVRFDNCFYLANASNEVKEATFLLRSYTDTRSREQQNQTQYFLAEHRFWKYYKPEIRKNPDGTYTTVHKKGDREAMVEYKIYRAGATSLNNLMAGSYGRSSVGWSEIPLEIRKLIKEDYNLLRIDEPQKLGFSNLGVEALLNDNGDISIPTGSNFGRGLIVPIIDDLIMYEVAESYAIRDMYNGKGTVYVPKNLSLGGLGGGMPINFNQAQEPITPNNDPTVIKFDGSNVGGANKNPNAFIPTFENPLEGVNNKYETIPGVDPQDQQVVVNQFNLRAQEWELIQENCLKRIAVKWGMSPKILSSFLAQGTVQMTATQIDSEDDISIAFINQTRANFKNAINRLLETTLNYYGHTHDVDIQFASPSIVNKDRILDRTLKKLEAGLIDIEEAIREINPDEDEETIQAKVQKAKMQQAMMMMAQQQEMNEMGEFGNNYDDLGGENLKGSTSPLQ